MARLRQKRLRRSRHVAAEPRVRDGGSQELPIHEAYLTEYFYRVDVTAMSASSASPSSGASRQCKPRHGGTRCTVGDLGGGRTRSAGVYTSPNWLSTTGTSRFMSPSRRFHFGTFLSSHANMGVALGQRTRRAFWKMDFEFAEYCKRGRGSACVPSRALTKTPRH